MMMMPRPPPADPAAVAPERRVSRRLPSPPLLPPSWGQAVAPPPTPFNVSPGASEAAGAERDRRHRHYHRHKCSHPHHQNGGAGAGSRRRRRRHGSSSNEVRRASSRSSLPYPDLLPEEEHQVVTYTYRFSGGGDEIVRDELPAGFHPACLAPPRRRVRHGRRDCILPSVDPSASWADCESERAGVDFSSTSYLSPRRFPSFPRMISHGGDEGTQSPPPVGLAYLNSQSNSPVFTTTGSSPDLVTSAPPASAHQTSPASPEDSPTSAAPTLVQPEAALSSYSSSTTMCQIVTTTTRRRRSALRAPPPCPSVVVGGDGFSSLPTSMSSSSSSRRPAKSVQWLSDVKKRPEDISSDRKVVKHQVRRQLAPNDVLVFALLNPLSVSLSRYPGNPSLIPLALDGIHFPPFWWRFHSLILRKRMGIATVSFHMEGGEEE